MLTIVKCEHLTGEDSEMPEGQACSFVGLCSYGEFNKYPSCGSHKDWDDQENRKKKEI